jgi:hypothetical protein
VFADNVIAVPRGRPPKEYRHKNLGAVVRLGLHKGVAILFTEAVTPSRSRTCLSAHFLSPSLAAIPPVRCLEGCPHVTEHRRRRSRH